MRRIVAALLLSLSGCHGGSSSADLSSYAAPAPPPAITPLDVDFDGKLHLVGFSTAPQQAVYPAGTKVTVTLWWRADQKLAEGWRLFSHLVGPEGQTLANLDESGPLRKSAALTPSRWTPGVFYRDEVTFNVPAGAPPFIALAAGVFQGAQRLPIKGRGGDRESRATVARLSTGEKDARAEIKELSVPKLAPGVTIALDGKLDEDAWSHAASTGPFVDVGSGRENPNIPSQGSARLLWDDHAMYVGVDVREAKVRGGWPAGAKDPHLWEKDTVEVMTDPDGDGDNKDYYEIQVNPQNLVFDTQYDDYNSPNGGGKGPFGHEEWSAALTSAVIVHGTLDDDSDTDQGYTVEMAIPWASFSKAKQSPPAPGDAWRMNFYAMKNNGGSAWSPILGMGNFHKASRFGRVRWVAAR